MQLLTDTLLHRTAILSPVVLAELFSNPRLSPSQRQIIARLPLLEIKAGFWERAGLTRAGLLRRRFRPRLADTLIAQTCIDGNVPLISRDHDFLPFARHAGLRLI